MTIAICGSIQFHKELRDYQHTLEKMGHTVLYPQSLDLIEQEGFVKPTTVEGRLKAEAKYDFLGEHFKKIEQSDAVFIVNLEKNGIPGYIGGNTFLEMGIAFYRKKKIYLLNPIPEMDFAKLEMYAMRPVVINGNLAEIK